MARPRPVSDHVEAKESAISRTTRIVYLDQQNAVREAFVCLLDQHQDEFIVVFASDSYIATEDFLLKNPVEVFMINPSRPDLFASLEVIHTVKSISRKTHILAFSETATSIQGTLLLQAGVSGYLGKDRPSQELLAALRDTARNIPWIQKDMLPEILQNIANNMKLTKREREILRLFANGARNAEIAERTSSSEHTVKKHMSNIFGKFAVTNRAELAFFIRHHGMVTQMPQLAAVDE